MKMNRKLLSLLFICIIFIFSSCKGDVEKVMYDDEYLIYSTNNINYLGNTNLNKCDWISQEDEEVQIENINLYLDGSSSMLEYLNDNDTEKYLKVVTNFEAISNRAYKNYIFQPYMVLDSNCYKFIKQNNGSTEDIEQSYKYISKSYNIKLKMNFLNYSLEEEVIGDSWRHIDINDLIYNLYNEEPDHSTLNVLVSPLENLRDNNLNEFYRNIGNYMEVYDFTYGFIKMGEINPLYMFVFGPETAVTNYVKIIYEQAIQSYSIASSEINFVVPDISLSQRNQEIPENLNINFDTSNHEGNLFIKSSEVNTYIPNNEYNELNSKLLNNFSSIELFPLDSVEGILPKFIGQITIDIPIYHSSSSWIDMGKWDFDCNVSLARGSKKLNLTSINDVYKDKLKEINKLDMSQEEYDYINNSFATRSDVEVNNRMNNDWLKLSEEYGYSIQDKNICSDNNNFEITSLESDNENQKFIINYEINLTNMFNDVPYLFDIKVEINPKYSIKDIPKWVGSNEMLLNIISPIYERAILPESEKFSRESVIIINKSMDNWTENEIQKIKNSGYIVSMDISANVDIEELENIENSAPTDEIIDEKSLAGKLSRLLTPKED